MVPLGTWIWLASELMFFSALFAAYFMIREFTANQLINGEPIFRTGQNHLNVPFAIANTAILVLSSFACQFGVHAAEHGKVRRSGGPLAMFKWGMREWYILTFIMGAFFIGGQAYEYFLLTSEGFVLQTNAYTSAFYLATGFHGLHVLGGLIAFLLMIGRTYLARTFTHEQRVHAIVTSYYWHFVDIVWIILFAVIYIIR